MSNRDKSRLDADHVQPNFKFSGTAALHATIPRTVVMAKQREAVSTNPSGPERLFHGPGVAGRGREQQPRTKLMMLANELDAGTIKHRYQVHTLTLDRLRAEAVLELKNEAVQPGPVKNLPGPNADDWFHWACGLQDGQDSATLVELRADFPALGCFISSMEENYWIAGKRAEVATIPLDWVEKYETWGSESMQESSIYPAVRSSTAAIPARLFPLRRVGKKSESGNHQSMPLESHGPKVEAESPCSTKQASVGEPENPTAAADLSHARQSDPQGQSEDTVLERLRTIVAQHDGDQEKRILGSLVQLHKEGDEAKVKSESPRNMEQVHEGEPEKGDPPTAAANLAHPPHDDPQGQSDDPELRRLRTIFAQHESDQENRILKSLIQRYKAVLACGAIAGILVLGVTFSHSAEVGASKLRAMLVAARTQALGTVQDSEIQKEVDLKLADLKNSSLKATVQGGAVTLAGYTSSQWESIHAESLTAQINGVKAVRNQIQVEPLPPPKPVSAKRVRHKSPK